VADGVLLYSAEKNNGNGNFLAILLKNERVELRYDMGSGVAIIRSVMPLIPGKWHSVKVTRGPKTSGSISVDFETVIKGRSPGERKKTKLGTKLYLGGWDQREVTLSSRVGVSTGFYGCVSKVRSACLATFYFLA
jgi:Laminin G domain